MDPADLQALIATNLRARRQELGLTTTAAAARAGISCAYWSQLESGVRIPSIRLLATLADALATTPDALLCAGIFAGPT
jgi:transcriptional regulator with XRE-family HTH domain